MYNFRNQSDESLANLSAAVHAEMKKRITDAIKVFPKPDLINLSFIENIKKYREEHKCTLMQAKLIVEYYMNNRND